MKRSKVRNLRIAMLHFGFFYSGGGEKLVLEELRGLRRLGYQVDCFAPYVDRNRCFPDYPEMSTIQCLLPAPPKWLPLRHAIWVLTCCVVAPVFAPKFYPYDVIFAANQPAPWIAFVLGRLLNKPYVAYLAQPFRLLHPREIDRNHGLRIQDGDQEFVRWISRLGRKFIDWADRTSILKASAVLTNGKYATNWIKSIYGRETVNCPAGSHPDENINGFGHDKWVGEIEVNGLRIAKPYILVTNRHAPHKRFEFALWGLKSIKRSLPNVNLIITGQESVYTEQLRYLAEGLALAGSVHFVGLVSQTELTRLYREAAVYVYPAPEEDFGMGMIEAMAAGTAVVAWNRAGPTGIVQHSRSGFLVSPFDTDEFAERILELLRHRELNRRFAEAGASIAHSTFSYDRHNRTIVETLEEAVVRHTGLIRAPEVISHPLPVAQLEPQISDADDTRQIW